MTTPLPEPASLRLLRRLVTVLTLVMIVGIVAITALIVVRLYDTAPVLPDHISLPGGASAIAITHGQGWYAVITQNQDILVFDALTGALRQTIPIR
ncbi:MAG: hypothetical protein GDA40_03905 [Rhodobacteraceae bacterium]|nr:hypothetical protein [Paracoccaceae bacterium]